jgi:hypothetical protein
MAIVCLIGCNIIHHIFNVLYDRLIQNTSVIDLLVESNMVSYFGVVMTLVGLATTFCLMYKFRGENRTYTYEY